MMSSLLSLLLSLLSTSPPTLIFLLAGQSNMSGRGGVARNRWDHIIPPQSNSNPSVLRLSPYLLWEQAHEPLHAGIDTGKVVGVGPGLIFANALRPAVSAETVVGLVPCAKGGTKISEWARGSWLYKRMVMRANAAKGKAAAVVWYQGESDTNERDDAEMYKGRMEELITNLREDLGDPQLLFIQVALASGEGNFTEMVRMAQKSINLPNVICVDAMGLPLYGEHLTTQAQVWLGKMLADAYLNHTALSTSMPSQ